MTISGIPSRPSLEQREARLRDLLRGFGRVVVAFSGGIDSSVLLRAAVDELGAGAVRAVLAVGPSLPARDLDDARDLAARIGVALETVETKEFEDERYLRNAEDRCYWCRSALGDALAPIAAERGATLVYGPVADDLDEDRPGMKAAAERGFRAPLLEAGLSKADVRAIAQRAGLPTWDKPASACLASRIPTGTPISIDALARVDRAERAVVALGFKVVRVRDHGDLARLEVGAGELDALLEPLRRAAVAAAVRGAGFRRVAVDLEGYRPAGLKS